MKTVKTLKIYAGAALLLAGGCVEDDFLYDSPGAVTDPDAVTFTAFTSAETGTRSGDKELFEPLVLKAVNTDIPLYLHTYESEEIGSVPGASDTQTRGTQIESGTALRDIHESFAVRAAIDADGAEYIGWSRTRPVSGSDVWATERTHYWPNQEHLVFHAISPYDQLSELRDLDIQSEGMTFSYDARKGKTDRDAEAQPDLLLAMSKCNKPESNNGRAPLKFSHALSAVKFAVRDVLAGEVVNVRLRGINGTGDCSFTTGTEDGKAKVTWSNQDNPTEFSQDFNAKIEDGPLSPDDTSSDIVINDAMPEKTFMMIPQELPDDAEIEITIRRNGVTPSELTLSGRIKSNNLKEWKPGHEYIYTISTSSSNWVYVLEAKGNHNSGKQIYVYSPLDKNHDKYGDKAYFNVKSYRYRANDRRIVEDLPWTASHGAARQYRVRASGDEYVGGRDITAKDWIQDPLGLKGNGSHTDTGERHDLQFAPHHVMTDWPGDKWMQDRDFYSGYTNSKNKPWDLSTAGNQIKRNTANCYVVDRGGWYSFPIVYGNGYKNGKVNNDAYEFSGSKQTVLDGGEVYLDKFTGYDGKAITAPDIPNGVIGKAALTWTDVYNTISDVEIATIDGKKMIRFHANKYNLQQGSAIIALYDKNGKIVWSWHIWITEHWLNPANGKPHAFDTGSTAFGFNAADKSGWRNRGDVKTTGVGSNGKKFSYHVSPYNIGWCDPKNVDYLRRPGTMSFVQFEKDGTTPSGLKASLPIMQDGSMIEYKYGNNTYYQFGRKDPIVGFVDHSNHVKRNFGPQQYSLAAQPVSIADGIKKPSTLFCKGPSTVAGNDWCNKLYVNLWNNNKLSTYANNEQATGNVDHVSYYHSLKTIYDPSPAGYMVPPAGVWKVVGKGAKGTYNDLTFKDTNLKNLNGNKLDDYTFSIWSASSHTNDNKLWLTSTGHRWYTDNHPNLTSYKGGDNFNPQIVYLWSSTPTGRNDKTAFGLALGKDGTTWGVCAFFYGRRSMARPVRAVRETYTHP